MFVNIFNRTLPAAAIGKTLLALAVGFVTLIIASPPAFAAAGSQQVAAAFEPSWFVQGITGLFALATLATGALALANIGHPILVDTATFTRVDNDEQVSAPNVRAGEYDRSPRERPSGPLSSWAMKCSSKSASAVSSSDNASTSWPTCSIDDLWAPHRTSRSPCRPSQRCFKSCSWEAT